MACLPGVKWGKKRRRNGCEGEGIDGQMSNSGRHDALIVGGAIGHGRLYWHGLLFGYADMRHAALQNANPPVSLGVGKKSFDARNEGLPPATRRKMVEGKSSFHARN